MFFNLSSQGLRWSGWFIVIILLSQVISYVYIVVFHISHPTSRLRANNFEESPESWRSSPQESRAFVKRVVSTFLFKARWALLLSEMSRILFSTKCQKNVASQAIVAMVIFANAIWLAIQTDWRLRLEGRKCQSFLFVWFYQSGHLTTVIPDHPNDLVRSC